MENVKLDRIDRKILRELQSDGRKTNVDIAKQVGISAPPCLRRLHTLEKEGYIRGYHADLAPEKMGYGLTAFVQIELINHNEEELAHFANLVRQWPQVRECHLLSGDIDFLLKVVTKDWEAFQRFLTLRVMAAPNVRRTKSAPTVRCVKYAPGVPFEEEG